MIWISRFSRWYESRDKYHLEINIISGFISCQNWYDVKMDMNRYISSQDDTHLEMIWISRYISSLDDIYLEINIISRWYVSQDDIYLYSYLEVHLKINDTNLEIIDIYLEMHKKIISGFISAWNLKYEGYAISKH